jgi:molybdopterin biosynthesis enzyme
MPVLAAQERLLGMVSPGATLEEVVPIDRARERVLSRPVIARWTLPVRDEVPVATLSGGQRSSMLRSLADTDALLMVPVGMARAPVRTVLTGLDSTDPIAGAGRMRCTFSALVRCESASGRRSWSERR